jgi:hypothetical protein
MRIRHDSLVSAEAWTYACLCLRRFIIAREGRSDERTVSDGDEDWSNWLEVSKGHHRNS